MAHKKAGGSSKLGRDSESKRLGIKILGAQKALAGQIIVRQRGNRYRAGEGVRQGRDDTLYATVDGLVNFSRKNIRTFTGKLKKTRFVSVK